METGLPGPRFGRSLQRFEAWLPLRERDARPEDQTRSLFLVILAFVTGGAAALVALLSAAFEPGPPIATTVLLVLAIVSFAVPPVFRRIGRRTLLATVMLILMKLAITALTVQYGGLFSSAIVLNLLFPFSASALLSFRAGAVFALVVIAEVQFFYALYYFEVPLPAYDAASESWFFGISFAVTVVVLMVFGFSVDLLRRRADLAQLRMERELLVARRLGELGELAAEIAHELNNPLSYTIANLEQLLHEVKSRPPEPKGVSEAVADALAGARAVEEQVARLLAQVSEERQRIESADLRAVLERAADTAAELSEHDSRPSVVSCGAVPRVRGHRASLDAVFLAVTLESLRQLGSGLEIGLDDDGPWVEAVFRQRRGSPKRKLEEIRWLDLEARLAPVGAEFAIDRRAGEITVRLPAAR